MKYLRTAWPLVVRGIVALLPLLPASAAAATIRVACVGDSITYGYGLSSPDTQSYPAQLQALLGQTNYDVGNFGVNGATLLKSGDNPYWNTSAYASSTMFAPNLVVIMLGTNDAKPFNWSKANYPTDYAALIQHYQMLGARVFIATPPPVYQSGQYSIDANIVANEVVPAVASIASDNAVTLIDVYTALQNHGSNFSDGVHPDQTGAGLIAQTVRATLVSATGSGGAGTGGAPAMGGAANGGASNASGGSNSQGGSNAQGGAPAVSGGAVNNATGGATASAGASLGGASLGGVSGAANTTGGTVVVANGGTTPQAASGAAGIDGSVATPSHSSGCSLSPTSANEPAEFVSFSLATIAYLLKRRRRSVA